MELKIRISPMMATEKSPLGSVEDRLLRVPKEVRDSLELSIGQYLTFKSIDGEMHLQVSRCYVEDAKEDNGCVYVTTDTHNRLVLKTMAVIQPAADILIGCDPEFFLINRVNNCIISASTFFSHHGEIGSDCGLAELRPRPAFQSAIVTKNIAALLKKTHEYIIAREKKVLKEGAVDMIAKSYHGNKAAGFHIHYGLPAFMLRDSSRTRVTLSQIISVLDYYVGILSILPEGKEDNSRRTSGGQYGKAGDHRFDSMTLEYRVPGGHLLRHPDMTNGLMSIGLLVMKDMMSRMKAYTEDFSRPFDITEYQGMRKMYPNLPDRDKVYAAISCNHAGPALEYSYSIFKDLEKMIGYKNFQPAIISYLNRVIKSVEGKERTDEHIVPNWRLVDERS